MLAGKLVQLRPIEPEDADGWYRWMNDPEVTLYYTRGYPVSKAEAAVWVERVSRENSVPNLTLAIETPEGRPIGAIHFEGADRESGVAELGIFIGEKDCWSRGYGTDAIRTFLRFGFDEANLNRVWLDVNEENHRAIACYEKCGFVHEARLRQHRYKLGRYTDSLIMAVLAGEFRALHAASYSQPLPA